MADVQPENGTCPVANELVEALCRVNLSGYEGRVIWALIRKTYGWHKTCDVISFSQFERLTNLDRRHIARALSQLEQHNMITRHRVGQKVSYAVQKDYDQWSPLPIEATVRHEPLPIEATAATIADSGNRPLPIQATEPLPIQVTTKTINNTIQNKTLTHRPAKPSKEPTTKAPPDPRVTEVMQSLEAKQGYKFAHYAQEAREVKRALVMSYTPEQIIGCWERLKSESFWKGKALPLAQVVKNLGEHVKGERVATRFPTAEEFVNG